MTSTVKRKSSFSKNFSTNSGSLAGTAPNGEFFGQLYRAECAGQIADKIRLGRSHKNLG